MNNQAEVEMKKYLGIPKDYKSSFPTLYKVATMFEEMTGNDQEITPFALVCWLDKYGDFTTKKDVYSKIVNKIFTGMGADMVSLFPFIELCQNDYKE